MGMVKLFSKGQIFFVFYEPCLTFFSSCHGAKIGTMGETYSDFNDKCLIYYYDGNVIYSV